MAQPQFVVITDRGTFKAAWISEVLPPHMARVEVVEDLTFVAPREHLVEQMSDMAGSYSNTESPASVPGMHQPWRGAGSLPEKHYKVEADRRAVENLAEAIVRVLGREKPESWSLSAPADIHRQLVTRLPKVCLDRLRRVLPKNLASADDKSILEHFQRSAVS